jgi:pimeloyl-ACP methyl ester carboxylesterase
LLRFVPFRRLALALAMLTGCSRPPPPSATTESTDAVLPLPPAAVASPPAPAPRELTGAPWQMEILDPPLDPFTPGAEPPDAAAAGTRIGVVSVPLGAREPRPIMVVLHGAGDRPEWECGSWRGITGAYPFLVCPRGVGTDAFLAWSSPADTKARIARAIAATRQMFRGWVQDTGAVVLVGFSMGSLQAGLLAQAEPKRYRRVVLVEGAFRPEAALAFGRPWARGGGERLILSCTTPGCAAPYRDAARNVAAQHVPARVNLAGTRAHGMFAEVVRSLRRDFPWLVAGAEGWDAFRPFDEDDPPQGRTERFGEE